MQNVWRYAQVVLMFALVAGMVAQFHGSLPYNCGPCHEYMPEWLCWLNGC